MNKFIQVTRSLYVIESKIESIEEHPKYSDMSILTLKSGKEHEVSTDTIYDSFKEALKLDRVFNWDD